MSAKLRPVMNVSRIRRQRTGKHVVKIHVNHEDEHVWDTARKDGSRIYISTG
jgi:hypothetical protein